jgi:heme/copper-type cytochrome/quinol oxidase subunit 2
MESWMIAVVIIAFVVLYLLVSMRQARREEAKHQQRPDNSQST